MKVLRVLALIFGILILLGGGVLVAASVAVDAGQSAINDELERQVQQAGLEGPVDGTITEVQGTTTAKVEFTAKNGQQYAATAQLALTNANPKVGDRVQVYYNPADPSQVVATDITTESLGGLASSLRIAGIAMLVVGALLIVGSIVLFVTGKKKSAAVAAAPGQPDAPPPGYPAGPAAPTAAYPQQQGYPPQPQPYPPQQQGYPPQQPQQPGYPPQQQGYPPQPPQQPGYPPQQQGYPPQPGQPTGAQPSPEQQQYPQQPYPGQQQYPNQPPPQS